MTGTDDTGYPLLLWLTGRAVLCVGAGRVATRRVPALLAAGAQVTVVAPAASPDLTDAAAAGRLVLHRRGYRPGDLAGAWLVHACTDDPAVNARVAADAGAARIWCVRADDRTGSTAWTPASGRVAGLTVAVNAGGDPGRASRVRDGIVAAARAGLVEPAVLPAGSVALVGGGPGDPGLITLRGWRLLLAADVAVTDRLAPRALLAHRPDLEVVDVGKAPGRAVTPQPEINALLVARARAGQRVVRLKGGDPFVLGRGGEELAACVDAGIPCEVVPGVSSATAGPALAGVPLTHRGVSASFVVVSGHLPPGHPRCAVNWAAVAGVDTIVLLMAVDHLTAIAAELVRLGRAADTPVLCVQEASTPAQRTWRSTLGQLPADAEARELRPPATVVVGAVVTAVPNA